MLNCKVVVEKFKIPFEINKYLVGELFLPDMDEKLPTLLMRTPYGCANVNALYNPLEVVRLGFVLAVQDVRGRGESDGIFDPFVNEADDGRDTIRWIRNQKWSNGQIYTFGVSYEGYTAMMGNSKTSLNGFASIVSTKNVHKQWFFEGKKIKQAFVQAWAHSFAYTDKNMEAEDNKYIRELADDLPSLYKRPLKEFPAGKYLHYYKEWINQGNSKYWNKVDVASDVDLSDTSGYYLSGWYDIFCEGTIEDYKKVAGASVRPQKLVIGPWNHNDLYSSLVGAIDFGLSTVCEINQMDIIHWFKKLSCDEISGNSEVVLYVMGLNKWMYFTSWPSNFIYKKLYLSSNKGAASLVGDGRLTWSNVLYDGSDSIYQNKNNFVPSMGGRCLDAATSAWGKGGAFIQRCVESRDDVLVYTSDILEKDVTIIGLVKTKFTMVSNRDATTIHWKITDVYKGDSVNVIDSCVAVNKAQQRQCITMKIGNIAYSFLKGHRIRIDISVTSFPRIAVDEYLYDYGCSNVIFWGRQNEACVYLPIVNLKDY